MKRCVLFITCRLLPSNTLSLFFFIPYVLKHIHTQVIMDHCADIMLNVCDNKDFRERVRDLGCIPTLVQLSSSSYTENFGGAVYNLARSESLHVCLQEAGLLEAISKTLREQPQRAHEVSMGYGMHSNIQIIPYAN
jgi:hypothetical protein